MHERISGQVRLQGQGKVADGQPSKLLLWPYPSVLK